jgi:hypothetical protein
MCVISDHNKGKILLPKRVTVPYLRKIYPVQQIGTGTVVNWSRWVAKFARWATKPGRWVAELENGWLAWKFACLLRQL